MSMEPILSLKNVCSYYDKVQVLYDINVDVYPGEIVSVIGANGQVHDDEDHHGPGPHGPRRGDV